MKIVKCFCIVGLCFMQAGCVVVGGLIDVALTGENDQLFQKMGRGIDNKIFSSDEDDYTKQKSLQRNCLYQTVEYEECVKTMKKTG